MTDWFPTRADTMLKMVQLIVSGELLIHISFSLMRLFAAVSAALLLGTIAGVSMGLNRSVEKIMAPFMYVMFPVPKAALLPILFILFGLGGFVENHVDLAHTFFPDRSCGV